MIVYKDFHHFFLRIIDGTVRTVDDIISELKYSQSFEESNRISRELFEHEIIIDQILSLMEINIKNNQVSDSWGAGKYILKMVKENKKEIKKINPELLEKFKKYFKWK